MVGRIMMASTTPASSMLAPERRAVEEDHSSTGTFFKNGST